jgi:glycosyltransferase involved in cell wall biosynthesis
MNNRLKISIIVPAFNEERLIAETLRQIQSACTSFTNPGWQTELIVCDNNSTDNTAKLATEAGANVVYEPINQIGRARNSGAAAASGDWLIFVDADSTPSQELFADVAIQIQSRRCMAGGSTVQFDGYHPIANYGIGIWNRLSRTMKMFAGSFIFCEATAFREIGGFSSELFASEEIDLSRRLKKLARARGKTIVILSRHPLLTSPRKLSLYSWRDYFRLFVRFVLTGGKAKKSRDDCYLWYDGRR